MASENVFNYRLFSSLLAHFKFSIVLRVIMVERVILQVRYEEQVCSQYLVFVHLQSLTCLWQFKLNFSKLQLKYGLFPPTSHDY